MIDIRLDNKWMRMAIKLAANGRPHPNPPVGAVLVQEGHLIGSGWHDGPGTPHAEEMALETCKVSPIGATLYVTLEPCCHTIGRDGCARTPCWQRCVDAGLARVVIAVSDVDPRTEGRGIQSLIGADIRVEVGILHEQALYQQRGFRSLQARNRPYVIHKIATTLDGHTACDGGHSRWITGPAARRSVHRLRSGCDAIIVGSGTVIADDPDLTVRSVPLPSGRQPHIVVLDRRLGTPVDAKVVRQGTTIFTTSLTSTKRARALTEQGCNIVQLAIDAYSISNVLTMLADIGMGIVLVEAGGEVSGAFYREQCVDEVHWYISPKLVGGGSAPVGLGGLPLTKNMSKAIELTLPQMRRYGVDVLITGRPVWKVREA